MPDVKGKDFGERNLPGQDFPKRPSRKECEHPEKLKGKPRECSPEQIKKCHGDVTDHPCVEKE